MTLKILICIDFHSSSIILVCALGLKADISIVSMWSKQDWLHITLINYLRKLFWRYALALEEKWHRKCHNAPGSETGSALIRGFLCSSLWEACCVCDGSNALASCYSNSWNQTWVCVKTPLLEGHTVLSITSISNYITHLFIVMIGICTWLPVCWDLSLKLHLFRLLL